jgi:hypothetical protein
MTSKTPESFVLTACLDYLRAHRVFAWRNNTGALRAQTPEGRGRFVRFGLLGSSDILGVLPGGRMLAVECKSSVGRCSESQNLFLASIHEAGGVAIVARSMEELAVALYEQGVRL